MVTPCGGAKAGAFWLTFVVLNGPSSCVIPLAADGSYIDRQGEPLPVVTLNVPAWGHMHRPLG